METEIKKIRKRNSKGPLTLLSQRELIKKINRSTRNSYKCFELLLNQK